jgi:TonB family protein
MRSSVVASRRRAFGFPFLLAFLLAGPCVQTAANRLPPRGIDELDSEAAAKLLIHVVKPSYPAIAKVNLVQGSVTLAVKVTREGRVAEAHVVHGEPLLAVAAMNAVRKWLYRPYMSAHGPAPFKSFAVVKFSLHPRSFKKRLPADANGYLERQIHPPEVINRPHPDPSATSLRLKVLVDSKGKALDASSPGASESELETARKNLQSWKFRPARWGSIAVPWYITVTVPLEPASLDQAANSVKH